VMKVTRLRPARTAFDCDDLKRQLFYLVEASPNASMTVTLITDLERIGCSN
jgi:hypothetical protein